MMRVKTIFSDKLQSRTFDRQAVKERIKSAALNRVTELGMPQNYPV
jgi:hypothetical protein